MRHFLFIILILLVFFSCKKPQTYSEIPNLEYKSFELKDTIDLLDNKIKSGILTVSFTDGDGDIGLNPSDTLTPFDTSSIYYYNLYIDVYKMQNDTLVFQDLQVPLRYRIQDLTPLGQNKTLKGKIKVSINYNYYENNDTFKYNIYIYDRALHKSNVIETPTLIIQ
ncbi:MAG: hypothetical protein DRI94_11900 [Bacteroidetes bacterium]|nr:MAG: hypothetical protein DRI94_11900 [Bacteroidota bacterium]